MPTRPGYVWDATASEWVDIGQAAVLAPVKYQATAPTSPATGDIWVQSNIDVPSIDSAQFLRWRKTMVGGETSLSGNDDSSLPLAYTPGYEQLYINGVLQVRGQDYTATTGTTVTGLTALVANDVVEVFSALARTVADVYTQTQSDARFVNKTVGGLNLVIPTGATNGTVGTNGAVTIGSAVSSVTVTGAFNATYDSYKIIISGGACSGTPNLALKLGASATGYLNSLFLVTYSTAATGSSAEAAGTAITWAGTGSTNSINMNLDLTNPFLAKVTPYFGQFQGSSQAGYTSGIHNVATSYADFTITPSTGTLTGGTIRIYGYNNGA